jgi:hypothetical protein
MRFRHLLFAIFALASGAAMAQNNPLTGLLRSLTNTVAPDQGKAAATNQPTSVMGVRGLDEVALKDATPAPAAVVELEKYAASAESATAAAKQTGLQERTVSYQKP